MNTYKYYTQFNTSIGTVGTAADDTGICAVLFSPEPHAEHTNAVTDAAKTQILEYLAGTRRKFDIPLSVSGTPFQKRVWHELAQIPYGETRTYGQIAENVGSPKGARAVGAACNKNPVPIIVPCHRVVGADGRLVGFAAGVDVKRALLETETNNNAECRVQSAEIAADDAAVSV